METNSVYVSAIVLTVALFFLMFREYALKTPKSKVVKVTRDTQDRTTRVLFLNGEVAVYEGQFAYKTDYTLLRPIDVYKHGKSSIAGHVRKR